MPAPYKHVDMTPEYNRIITALTNITDDIRILRNSSEDGDGGNTKNKVMNGMEKALLAVSMSGAGGGNAEAVRQEIETPTAINGNTGAPAELAGEDAIYSGSEWSRVGQLARFGIEEDIEEERFLIRVDGAFYYEAEGGFSGEGGEETPPVPPSGVTSAGVPINNPLLTDIFSVNTGVNVVMGDLDFGSGGSDSGAAVYLIDVTGDITAYPFTVIQGNFFGQVEIYPTPAQPEIGGVISIWWSRTPGGPQLPGDENHLSAVITGKEGSHAWDQTGTVGYGCLIPNEDVTLYLNLQLIEWDASIGPGPGAKGTPYDFSFPSYIAARVSNIPSSGGKAIVNVSSAVQSSSSKSSPYSSSTVASEDIGEVGPIKQVRTYTKGEYIGYKSMDPAIGYSTGEPSGVKSEAGDDDIPDITLPNRRWPPKRPEWKTALAIPNPLADLVNPITGITQPKSKEQQDLEAVNSAVAPESANPLQALGIAAGIELIKSLPDFAAMGSDGSLPKPPEFAFGGGLLNSMEDFIGEEWDGTVPRHVSLETYIPRSYAFVDPITSGDIGPYGNPPFPTAYTSKVPIPNQGKINSYKIILYQNKVHGGVKYIHGDGNGQTDHWRVTKGLNGPTQTVHWISDTPGGPPKTNGYGEPIVVAGQVATILEFRQVYDLAFIRDGERGPASIVDGKPAYFNGYEDKYSVLLPVVDKTYFYNIALVNESAYWEATRTVPGPGDLVTYVPDPDLWGEDYQYILDSVPLQSRTSIGRRFGLPTTTKEQFLELHMIRTISDSTEDISYIGKDATMEQFIGSNEESYPSHTEQITEWENIEGPIRDNFNKDIPDIGFGSSVPLARGNFNTDSVRKYPIPTDGTIAVAEFSFGFRPDPLNTGNPGFPPNFLRNNSTFGLRWAAPADDLNSAWYDLDLMPIAWMSSEPGGEPQTLVDGSTGLIIKLEKTGAIYKAQQLLSTTESMGSDRATFPIMKKKYFVNVAVVSTSTADTLVASGTAPLPEQCESYTSNDEQFLQFDLENRINDKSDKLIGS